MSFRTLVKSLGKRNVVAKNCPFCNGISTLAHDRNEVGAVTSFVVCTSCQARTRQIVISEAYSSDDTAMELWNTRYSEPESEETEEP